MSQDAHILKALSQGDESALEKIFYTYQKYLLVIAYQYLNDEGKARDAVQDIFMDLWKRREHIEIHISLKAFLRQAVINKSLAKIRKEKRIDLNETAISTHSPNVDGVDKQFENSELQHVVSRAIDTLPEKCREVFSLSRIEQLSHKEISDQLNISTKTIENHITRALKTIREALKEYGVLALIYFIIKF